MRTDKHVVCRRSLYLTFFAMACLLTGVPKLARAQDSAASPPRHKQAKKLHQATATPPAQANKTSAKPKISKPMMMKCRMMMKMKVASTDPAALLAARHQLGLSDAQVTALKAIASGAREAASHLLTDSQRRTVKQLDGTADTSMQMHKDMMAKMKSMMHEMKQHKSQQGETKSVKSTGQTSAKMACPMMKDMKSATVAKKGDNE